MATAAIAICILCLTTAYMPVTLSRGHQLSAKIRPSTTARLEDLRKAVASDRLDPRPWRGVAELRFFLWNRTRSRNLWQEFESAAEELVRRDPVSYSTSDQLGMWYLLAHESSKDKAHLEQAYAFLRKSTVSNSSSSIAFARLAWVCSQADRTSEASEAAREALRLDELNPHIERSLKRQQLFLGIPGSKAYPHSRLGGEQLLETLRKMINSDH